MKKRIVRSRESGKLSDTKVILMRNRLRRQISTVTQEAARHDVSWPAAYFAATGRTYKQVNRRSAPVTKAALRAVGKAALLKKKAATAKAHRLAKPAKRVTKRVVPKKTAKESLNGLGSLRDLLRALDKTITQHMKRAG